MRAGRVAVAAALAVVVSLCWQGGARAGAPGEADLAAARRAYQDMKYKQVIRLTAGLTRRSSSSRSHRVEALELTGLSQLILGHQAAARRSFEALLELSPGHTLRDPSGSPKLRRFFESVRKERAPDFGGGGLKLKLSPPADGKGGETVKLEARVSGEAARVAQAMLRWKTSLDPTWQGAPMSRRGAALTARFGLPASGRPYTLLFYAVARDSAGNLLARAGTESKPMRLEVSPGERREAAPVWKRWWFWTAVGAVVVGGVTVGAVLLTTESAPGGNLTPGVVQLR